MEGRDKSAWCGCGTDNGDVCSPMPQCILAALQQEDERACASSHANMFSTLRMSMQISVMMYSPGLIPRPLHLSPGPAVQAQEGKQPRRCSFWGQQRQHPLHPLVAL